MAPEQVEVGRVAHVVVTGPAERELDVALVEIEDRDHVQEHRGVAGLTGQPPAEVDGEDDARRYDGEDPGPLAASEQADHDEDARDEQSDKEGRGDEFEIGSVLEVRQR